MPRVQQSSTVSDNTPIQTIRHRSIKAAIWRRQTAKGPMYDVKVTRSYKQGDEWRDSFSFGYDDLLIVAKLIFDAHSFITAERAKDNANSSRSPRRREQPAA
jgi:hypothetical protein